MKRIYIFMAISFLFVILYSCKNDDLFSDKKHNEIGKNELSLQEAEQLLSDFTKNDLKTKSNLNFKVENVKKHNYQIKHQVKTKSGETIDENIPVYEFTLKSDQNEGFALVLSDRRIQNVLAYSLNGSLNDTIFNLGLKYFFRTIPDHIKYSLSNYSLSLVNITKSAEEEDVTYHYCEIPVKWGQGYPFNANVPLSCPDNEPIYHGKAPAGCVAIAVAQVMAYHAQPIDFKWDVLLGSTYITENSPINMRTEVAKLVADIGVKVNMSYGCSASGSYITNARTALGRYGYRCDIVDDYNTQRIINSINSDFPVLLGGDDGAVGHLWVVDGRRSSTLNGVSQNWLQMNWGWYGGSDGWYFCYEPPVFDSGSYEFNHNLTFLGNIEYW